MTGTQEKLMAGIPNVIEKIRKFHAFYEGNEAAVRTQIIEPVLKLLDRDIEDPDNIQRNVSFEEGVPDGKETWSSS